MCRFENSRRQLERPAHCIFERANRLLQFEARVQLCQFSGGAFKLRVQQFKLVNGAHAHLRSDGVEAFRLLFDQFADGARYFIAPGSALCYANTFSGTNGFAWAGFVPY